MFRKKKDVKVSGNVTPDTLGYAAYSFMVPDGGSGNLLPSGLRRELEKSCFPCFMVYHDHDTDYFLNRKRPHFHVMVLFDEEMEAAPVYRLAAAVHGYGLYGVPSPRSFARYMCHLDNPDKHQYNPKLVSCVNGCVYEDFIK